MFESNTGITHTYGPLVRNLLYSMHADSRIYRNNLDEVRYGWERRFWPSVLEAATRIMDRFPNLETFTIQISPPKYGQEWIPAFFAVQHKTRAQRVELAARWMRARCPLENERLRACLQLELTLAPGLSAEDFKRSKFAPDEDEESWDPKEFHDAFQRAKNIC